MRKRLSTGVYDTVPTELHRLPPLAVDVLVRLIIPLLALVVAAVLAFGCGHAPSVADATKGGQLALGFVREAADELEHVHALGTDAAIEYCRARVPADADAAARESCLRGVGFAPEQIDEHKAALAKLRDAYDAIADGLAAIDAAWPVLQDMADRAKAVRR